MLGFYFNLIGMENLEIFVKLCGIVVFNFVKRVLEIVGLFYKNKKLFSKYLFGMK